MPSQSFDFSEEGKRFFQEEVKSHADKIFGLLAINITAKSQRTSVTLQEYVQISRQAGISDQQIEDALLEDLRVGGRIFGEFLNGFKADIKGRMNGLSDEVFRIRAGTKEKKKWITVSDSPCPDCLPRHNQVDTDRNWELRGKPRDGWSVCRTNCKCKLIPVSQIARHGEIPEPLKTR